METQSINEGQCNSIIENGNISADTIDKDKLISICKEILKESIKLGQMDDQTQSKFIAKYRTFSQEYPAVFNDIMIEKRFYVTPFIKFIQFRQKQPLVYTDSISCVRDLCYYPLQLFKFLNTHYNESEYREFKQKLQEQMLEYHNAQKEQLKYMVQKVSQSQEKIKENLIQNLIQLATQKQLEK